MYIAGTPPPSPLTPDPAPPPSRRGPKILIIVGVVLNLVGWGAFIVGFVFLGFQFADLFQTGIDPTRELDLTVEVPGEGTVDLEAGRYQVVALGPSLTYATGQHSDAGGRQLHRGSFTEPTVTVTGPDGEELSLEPPSHERLTSSPNTDAVGLTEFSAPTDGTYTLSAVSESSDVTEVGIGEARSLWEEASGWLGPTLIITGGSLVGTLGIFVLIAGIIWLVVRSASSRATPRPYPTM